MHMLPELCSQEHLFTNVMIVKHVLSAYISINLGIFLPSGGSESSILLKSSTCLYMLNRSIAMEIFEYSWYVPILLC